MALLAGRKALAFAVLTTLAVGLGACQTKTAGLYGV